MDESKWTLNMMLGTLLFIMGAGGFVFSCQWVPAAIEILAAGGWSVEVTRAAVVLAVSLVGGGGFVWWLGRERRCLARQEVEMLVKAPFGSNLVVGYVLASIAILGVLAGARMVRAAIWASEAGAPWNWDTWGGALVALLLGSLLSGVFGLWYDAWSKYNREREASRSADSGEGASGV